MNESIVVSGILVSLVVSAVGFLVKRSVDANDKGQEELKVAITAGLAALAAKVDSLATKDGQHSEAIVEIRVRLSHVETELIQLQRSTQRRRTDDEGRQT